MPSQEEIAQQQDFLEIHRRTLAHYLKQQAILGIAHTPPAVVHGIFDARRNIRRIKNILRDWGVFVEAHPDDDDTTLSEFLPQANPVDHSFQQTQAWFEHYYARKGEVRKPQLRISNDERGIALAKTIVSGKVQNQANLLRYWAKNRKRTNPALYATLIEAADAATDQFTALRQLVGVSVDIIERLLTIQKAYNTIYWSAIAPLIPANLNWPGRQSQRATDRFNQVLNYAYGVLYMQVKHALILAELDPYIGILHANLLGRPSLALDLMEEFRQIVVDRTIIRRLLRGWKIGSSQDGRLNETTRKRIAELVLERLDDSELYEGKHQPINHIIRCQARHLAAVFQDTLMEYKPFVCSYAPK